MKDKIYDGVEKGIRVLKTGTHKGMTYEIVTTGTHPNAYIKIPEKHMLHGVFYDNIILKVHGGLTYAGKREGKNYWIGWDYAHLEDHLEYGHSISSRTGKKWTVKEIEEHCKDAIEQISRLKKFQYKLYYYAETEED